MILSLGVYFAVIIHQGKASNNRLGIYHRISNISLRRNKMYLKRIELQGFKSFTAKTNVSFEPGISCIVGPNGSGKSNIADALRWVLGEQNARSIRGGKLEDVIFSGTQKKRPLGMAEVSIILDNSDGYLPLEFSDVSVTRRAVRGGNSEYLINGEPCRLKDIRELFTDTGIGVEGVSLINQGRINELINARPDERRVLVEEAAGIVKYRDRKREAVRKLAETERHLETIGVVINELAGRIEPLTEQAAKAEQYLQLREEADRMEMGISVRVLSEAEDKIAELDAKMQEREQQMLAEESQRLAFSAEIEELRLLINEHDETVASSSHNYYELQTRQEKEEGDLRLLQSRRENAAATMSRLTGELTALEAAIAAKQQEVAELAVHVERTASEIAAEEESILHGEGGESNIREHIGLLADKLSAMQKEMNSIAAEHSGQESQLEFKAQLLQKNEENLCRLQEEEGNLSAEQEQGSKQEAVLLQKQDAIKAKLQKLSIEANENETLLRQLNTEMAEAAAEEADKRYHASSAKTKVSLLSELAAGYEGFFPGVKALMTAKRQNKAGRGIIDVISALMDVPADYRVAIEAYLGANIQNVVAEDAASARAAISYLKQERLGRATFLPLDILQVRSKPDISAAANMPGVFGLASELVECEKKLRPAVEFLLNSLVIADNMDTAMAAAKQLKYKVSVVTLDGDMVNPGASVSGGSRGKKSGELLSQKAKLKAAEQELSELEAELAAYSAKVLELRATQEKANANNEAIAAEMSSLSAQLAEISAELNQMTYGEESRDQRLTAIRSERTMLSHENDNITNELAELRAEYEQTSARKQELESDAEATRKELEALQQQMSGHQDQITARKMSLASSRQKLHGQSLTLARLKEEQDDLGWEAEEKASDREAAAKEAEELVRQIAASEEQLRMTGLSLHDALAQLEQLKHGLAAETGRLLELEKQEKELSKKRETLQNEKHQLALRCERWRADFENEATKLSERFQMDLAMARAKLGDEISSRTAMQSRLSQLRREMAALGDVNLGAIAEAAEVTERYAFLTGQRDDMLAAREKLDKVIAEMDKIMMGRFKDAYEQLSAAFDKSFNRLFGGGSAALYLSEPDDILETGVEIRVDPPGKKVANYNLLSGGEKSLIGIALMFAMLAVRPTPFCVMDEVDAALDEANINRFTDFLTDKASGSQFVMITHRQSTMEVASTLWGVTMEEEGISKVLSVKLEEAV